MKRFSVERRVFLLGRTIPDSLIACRAISLGCGLGFRKTPTSKHKQHRGPSDLCLLRGGGEASVTKCGAAFVYSTAGQQNGDGGRALRVHDICMVSYIHPRQWCRRRMHYTHGATAHTKASIRSNTCSQRLARALYCLVYSNLMRYLYQ